MAKDSSTKNPPAAPTVLLEDGIFLSRPLHDMVQEDVDTLVRVALRYRGIHAEIAVVHEQHPTPECVGVAVAVGHAVHQLGLAVQTLRDLAEEVQDYHQDVFDSDIDDDDDDDEEE